MNNKVTPMPGQVFEFHGDDNDVYSLGYRIRLAILHPGSRFTCTPVNFEHENKMTIGHQYIHENFKFVPQDDLEWLAVNADKCEDSAKILWRKGNFICFTCDENYLNDEYNTCQLYTKQQWQECRYKLGLDTRPKEDEVMDLRLSKDGYKYVSEEGFLYITRLRGNKNIVMECPKGRLVAFEFNGYSCFDGTLKIIARYEPRPWLKELPDVSWFEFYDTKLISCDEDGKWSATGYDNRIFPLNYDMTPRLSGDQWKESIIYIKELKVWQANNP